MVAVGGSADASTTSTVRLASAERTPSEMVSTTVKLPATPKVHSAVRPVASTVPLPSKSQR